RGRERKSGGPEDQVNGWVRRSLGDTEGGGVVPAVRKIRLESMTIQCFVARTDRRDVDGHQARVRAYHMMSERELEHGLARFVFRRAGLAPVEQGHDLAARPVRRDPRVLTGRM